MTKVIPTLAFVATVDGVKYRAQEGVAIEMPKGANWVEEGLAELAEAPKKKSSSSKKSSKGK